MKERKGKHEAKGHRKGGRKADEDLERWGYMFREVRKWYEHQKDNKLFFKKGEIACSQHSNLWNGHMKRWFFMGKSILLFLQMFPTEPLLPVTQTVRGRRCLGGHPSMGLQNDLCQSPGSVVGVLVIRSGDYQSHWHPAWLRPPVSAQAVLISPISHTMQGFQIFFEVKSSCAKNWL